MPRRLTVTLMATSLLTLSTTAGLTFTAGDGIADQTMTFSGSLAAINAALDGLIYDPTENFGGAGTVEYSFDNGVDVTRGSFFVDVAPVADVPVLDIADAAPGTPMPLTGELLAQPQLAPVLGRLDDRGARRRRLRRGVDRVPRPARSVRLGRRFDADGQPVGSFFSVAGSSFDEPLGLSFFSLASLDGGGFAVTWHQHEHAHRRHATSGRRATTRTACGSATASWSTAIRLSRRDSGHCQHRRRRPDGDVVLVRSRTAMPTASTDSATTTTRLPPAGAEFRVNTATAGDQLGFRGHDVSPMAASLVTWTSSGQDGDGEGIYGQRFDATGAADGAEFLVNATTAGDQRDSSGAALAGGGFLVAWEFRPAISLAASTMPRAIRVRSS